MSGVPEHDGRSDTEFSDVESSEDGSPSTGQPGERPGLKLEGDERTQATFALAGQFQPTSYIAPEMKAEAEKWVRPRAPGQSPATYYCPECGKALSRMDSLTRHRRSRHHIGKMYHCRSLQCESLNRKRVFARFDRYKDHMRTCHQVTVKPSDALLEDEILDASPQDPDLNLAGTAPRWEQVAQAQGHVKMQHDQAGFTMANTYHQPPGVAERRPVQVADISNGGQLFGAAVTSVSVPFPALEANVENFESMDRDELVQRLRARTLECQQLQQKCRILNMERDEYIEALAISEKLKADMEKDRNSDAFEISQKLREKREL